VVALNNLATKGWRFDINCFSKPQLWVTFHSHYVRRPVPRCCFVRLFVTIVTCYVLRRAVTSTAACTRVTALLYVLGACARTSRAFRSPFSCKCTSIPALNTEGNAFPRSTKHAHVALHRPCRKDGQRGGASKSAVGLGIGNQQQLACVLRLALAALAVAALRKKGSMGVPWI
jgi:hypothetical protein